MHELHKAVTSSAYKQQDYKPSQRPHLTIIIRNKPLHALIDSGASISLLRQGSIDESQHEHIKMLNDECQQASGAPLAISKILMAEIFIPRHNSRLKLALRMTPQLDSDCILGSDFLAKTGAVIDFDKGQITLQSPDHNRSNSTFLGEQNGPATAAVAASVAPTRPSNGQKMYLVSAEQNVTLLPQQTITMKVKIETPHDLIFQPGAQVVSSLEGPSEAYSPDALAKVAKGNKIYIFYRNLQNVNVHINKGQIVPGIFISPIDPKDITLLDQHWLQNTAAKAAAINNLKGDKKNSMAEQQELLEQFDVSDIPAQWIPEYRKLIIHNQDVFSKHPLDLGVAPDMSHTIHMKTNDPVYVSQFRIPVAHEKFIDEWAREMLKNKVLKECHSQYNSPLFLVPKKDREENGTDEPSKEITPKTWRIVQDFRQLNANSQKDLFSIMDARETIEKLGRDSPCIFSNLDLSGAFWQLSLAEKDQHLTAFTLKHSNLQYCWRRLPMGLQGASSSFARLLGKICRTPTLLEGTISYIDDLAVTAHSHEQNIQRLAKVFQRLRENNLKLNMSKCALGKKSISYLGFSISEKGIAPDETKVKAIKNMPPPRSIKGVQHTMGLFNFFRSLIRNFAQKTQALHDLTSKKSSWKEGEPLPTVAEKAFQQLKEELCSKPIIMFPKMNKPIKIYVDAALGDEKVKETTGMGAIITQNDDEGNERPVAYWSRALKGAEHRYSAFAIEMKAVLGAVQYFRHFIIGSHQCQIYTDHRPLVDHCKRTMSTISGIRDKLMEYPNIQIFHIPGKSNMAADALSRNVAAAINFSLNQPEPDYRPLQTEDWEINTLSRFVKTRQMEPSDNEDPKATTLIRLFGHKVFIKNDVLYLATAKQRDDARTAKVWVPKVRRNQIMAKSHNHPLAGHWAVARTVHNILTHFFWPSIASDTADFIQKCLICQQANRAMEQKPHRKGWTMPDDIFQRVNIDLTGPFFAWQYPPNFDKKKQRSKKNKKKKVSKYILVMCDAFSKWCEIVAIPNKEAETVVQAIYNHWLTKFGPPNSFVFDNGPEFKNKKMKEVANQHGINLFFTPSYAPEVNAQVEIINKSIKAYLRKFADENTHDWEDHVASLQFAQNIALNRSIGTSPFKIMFNKEPRLPWILHDPQADHSDLGYAFKDRVRDLAALRQMAMFRNRDAQLAYMDYYNKKAVTPKFQLGDQVLFFRPPPTTEAARVNNKIWRPWKGIYKIIKVREAGTFDIQQIFEPNKKFSNVTADKLKLRATMPPNLIQYEIPSIKKVATKGGQKTDPERAFLHKEHSLYPSTEQWQQNEQSENARPMPAESALGQAENEHKSNDTPNSQHSPPQQQRKQHHYYTRSANKDL